MANGHRNEQDGTCLYYYCSLSTFESMCTSKQLWLSDIRKSNDREELSYGLRQIKHRLDVLCKAANLEGRRPIIRLDQLNREMTGPEIAQAGKFVAGNLQHLYRTMDANRNRQYEHFAGRQCLALCFAGNGDLLSQWRGYGNNGKGVAVGFERASIRQYVKTHAQDAVPGETLRFQPVYYREHDGERYSAGYTKHRLRDLPFQANHYELTRGNLFRENEIALIDKTLQVLLSEYFAVGKGAMPDDDSLHFVAASCEDTIPLLKEPSFYEETEERLFVWANPRVVQDRIRRLGKPADDTRIGAAIRGDRKLAAHVALPIIAKNEHERNTDHVAMSRVVIGPRCEASEAEIETMLHQSGIEMATIRVAHSQSPYTG